MESGKAVSGDASFLLESKRNVYPLTSVCHRVGCRLVANSEWLRGSQVELCLLLVASVFMRQVRWSSLCFWLVFDGIACIRASPSCWIDSWSHA